MDKRQKIPTVIILGLIWLAALGRDRLWLALDRSIPAWDQANHLTASLNYLQHLQNAHWFDGQWWQHLWKLSSFYPPLTYILTAPFQQLFGASPDGALWVNSFLSSAILLISIYGLGKHLFNQQVGLWAVGLCILLPRLYLVRIEYLIDYPLTALVVCSFWCLTVWRDAKTRKGRWVWGLVFGLCFGLAMLTKQSVLFFLFGPLLWLGGSIVRKKNWARITQLACSFLLFIFIFAPWYSNNWLFFFGTRQTVYDAAIREGDPALNTLRTWTYYFQDLPTAISWPLLMIPLGILLLYSLRKLASLGNPSNKDYGKNFLALVNSQDALSLRWLGLFFFSSYLICSSLLNKDGRYIIPYLPIVAIIGAYGLTLLPRSLAWLRPTTIILAFLLMVFHLFPIGGSLGNYLVHHPYQGKKWPHQNVITEIRNRTPHRKATIGLLTDSAQINHNNINYYGILANFQVYGREIGVRKRYLQQDQDSVDWFLIQTGEAQRHLESQALMVQAIEGSADFQLGKSWDLPDDTLLKLYHRRTAPIEVKPLAHSHTKISLDKVIVPA